MDFKMSSETMQFSNKCESPPPFKVFLVAVIDGNLWPLMPLEGVLFI